MYYFYEKAINTENFSGTKKVLIAYLDQERDSVVLSGTLLGNVSEHYGVKVACTQGVKSPLLVLSDDVAVTVNITKIWEVVTANLRKLITGDPERDEEAMNGERANQMVDAFTAKLAPMFKGDTRLTKRIVFAIKAEFMAEEIIESSRDLSISDFSIDKDFYEETSRCIKSTRNLNEAELKNKSIVNQTVKQLGYEDTLFVKIPSTKELTGMSEFGYSIPAATDVSVPYNGDDNLRRVGSENDVANIAMRDEIVGKLENNKDPRNGGIYQNEQSYYDELMYALEKAAKETGLPDGILPQEAQNYLLDLAEMFYVMHWAHSPRVPDFIIGEDEEDDDSDTVIGKYASRSNSGKTVIDACIYLREFLVETAASKGFQIFVSAIVQLARWGKRKQTSIVFDDSDLRFDLYDGLVRDVIGNMADYTVEKTAGGKELHLFGLIFPDIEYQDTSIGLGDTLGFPVGAVLVQHRKNAVTGKTLTLRKCLHIVDLLHMTATGELQVDGIRVEDGKVSIGVPSIEFESYGYAVDACAECSKRCGNYNIDITNKEILDIFSDIPGIKTKPNVLGIMSELRAAPMLASKVRMINPAALHLNAENHAIGSVSAIARYFVAAKLLPVYKEALAAFGDTVLPNASDSDTEKVRFAERVMNCWADAIVGFSFKQSAQPDPAPQQHQPAPATAFGALSQPAPAPAAAPSQPMQPAPQPVAGPVTQPSGSMINWIGRIENGSKLFRVVNPSREIIAYCYMTRIGSSTAGTYTQYTLTTKTDGREIVNDESKVLTLERITAVLLHNIILSMKGAKISQILFESEEDITKIRDLLNVRK